MKYQARPCPCGDRVCKNWFVSPPAAVQGVGFTKMQAEAVAELLNSLPDACTGCGGTGRQVIVVDHCDYETVSCRKCGGSE